MIIWAIYLTHYTDYHINNYNIYKLSENLDVDYFRQINPIRNFTEFILNVRVCVYYVWEE